MDLTLPGVDLSRVAAVSWDVDGTLYDMDAVRRDLRSAWWRRLWRGDLRAAWRSYRALVHHQRFVASVRANGGVVPPSPPWQTAAGRAFERRWLLPAIGRAGARPRLSDALTWCACRGWRQVVVSDFPPDEKLRALALESWFVDAIAGSTLRRLKPSPVPLRHAAERLGVPVEHVLHVGDRPACDGASAREAGAQFVHIDVLLGALDAAAAE